MLVTTDPEEFPALLDHVCQAMSGSQVLVQVSLVRLSQCLLPVHHPLTKEEGEKGKTGGHSKISKSTHQSDSGRERGQRKSQGLRVERQFCRVHLMNSLPPNVQQYMCVLIR